MLLSGEPGIGKSRLIAALDDRLSAEPHTRLRYFCSPYHINSALHPVITQLERAAGLDRDDSADIKLDKLEALLRRIVPDVARDASVVGDAAFDRHGRPISSRRSCRRRRKRPARLPPSSNKSRRWRRVSPSWSLSKMRTGSIRRPASGSIC